MERQRIVVLAYVVFGLRTTVRGTVQLLADGVSLWPVLTAACGLLLLVALARSVVRGEIDGEFERTAENDVLFWSLVVATGLGVALIVYDLLTYDFVLS
ncbi:hypothetical protein [Halopelagius longus]|uniref:Uncharacterized protein n=1 Tax=Halopelagius longus TaxID=1236180 RepID=A0A1H0XZF0_9EURY|nr:hypothetical protein [Halopelagius longus]RDI72190.1 hypothetical protein DWB78_10965 [Halopelagius longus]SDQ08253.1 hypothetical protein SAMN05216278_0301 [Halopelagius longus]